MGIKAKFTKRDIDHAIDGAISEVHDLMIKNLSYVGEYAASLDKGRGGSNETVK